MRVSAFVGFVAVAMVATACGGSAKDDIPLSTPEDAVVTWFEAVDAGDVEAATASIHPESLALILGIENSVSHEQLAEYLSHGVPEAMQQTYWASFSEGFTEFADRPLSTLKVGEAEAFVSEGEEFASVPVSGGNGSDSVVIVRKAIDGTWEVDMVASLGDGFSTLLLNLYDELDASEASNRIRLAYVEVVAPAMWAAMVDGSFGDDFAVTALTIIDHIDEQTG
ncbi:MAG: hypothetical protein M5U23_05645 [Acidimicrobiia bacterium]|nr:hypothetical protein [Acidimicrobiia bacterium]